jgi:hypothetical protein
MYLSDIFELGVVKLNEVLTERLFSEAIVPVLLTGICSSSSTSPGTVVPVRVQMFLIRLLFETFHSRMLLEPLAAALFSSCSPPAISLPNGMDHLPGRFNPYRTRLVQQFENADDRSLLLASAVVHGCICKRDALPRGFLEAAKILPPSPVNLNPGSNDQMGWLLKLLFHPLGACRPSNSKDSVVDGNGDGCESQLQGEQAELLVLLLQSMSRQEDWQLDTLRTLSSILLAWFAETAVQHSIQCQALATEALHVATRQAARRAVEVLEQGRPDDQVLDILLEEWELQLEPPLDVHRSCGDPSCLLPSSPSQSGDVDGSARKAVRSFLMLRRLLLDLVEQATALQNGQSWQGKRRADNEKSPLAVEETDGPDALREGVSFEIGNVERVMCTISAPEGKSTRYLITHDFWLLLAQPDLSTPGWAVVKTTWPLWQVLRARLRMFHRS